MKPGMIEYMGSRNICVAYGPKITEPLAASGGIVAMVDKADLDKLYQACRDVWNSQYVTHKLATMVTRRKE